MKLLFVSPAYAPAWSFGGVVASWHRLLEEMVRQGDDVTVYTTNAGLPSGTETGEESVRVMNGVNVHYFTCDWRNPILSRALTRRAKESIGRFDLMHLAGVWQPLSIGVRRAAVTNGCPYVVSFHGALDPWPRTHKRWKKLLYYLLAERKNIQKAAGIRFTSRMESDWSSHYASECQEQRIIPNGIDFESWRRDVEAAKQWRLEAGIPLDCFLFLNVGRLHRKKNLELAIKALTPLRTRNWRFALVGKDEDGTKAELVRQATILGFAERISFHPTVSEKELPKIYSAGDLFILPSHHENFCNAVPEALACECPVLISDQVGISGDLQGIRGVQVRPRVLSLWSEALSCALDRADEFKICQSDRNELERRFSIKHCACKMREFHDRVLAQSHAQRQEPT